MMAGPTCDEQMSMTRNAGCTEPIVSSDMGVPSRRMVAVAQKALVGTGSRLADDDQTGAGQRGHQ